jgi:cytochrome c5
MRERQVVVVLAVVLWVGAAIARLHGQGAALPPPSSVEALSERDRAAKATFETVCSSCHDTAIATTSVRTVAEWAEVIDLMVGNGALATDAQFAEIQGYLARQYGRVNLNRAPSDELQAVLDVSADTAQAIVALRGTRRLTSPDDLKEVAGITAATLERVRARLQF